MSITQVKENQREKVVNQSVKSSIQQPLPAIIPFALGIYAILLSVLTLFKNKLSLGGMWDTEAHQQRSLDLELFNGFVGPPVWWGPWTNTLGNIGLFVPLGFFLYFLLKQRSRFPILEATLLGAFSSLVIEVAQWTFSVGYTDLDDLLFNSLGGFLGAWIASKVPRIAVTKLSSIIGGACLVVLVLIMISSAR